MRAAYDFGAHAVVADIGGGRGHLLQAIVARYPNVAGVLFEMLTILLAVLAIQL